MKFKKIGLEDVTQILIGWPIENFVGHVQTEVDLELHSGFSPFSTKQIRATST